MPPVGRAQPVGAQRRESLLHEEVRGIVASLLAAIGFGTASAAESAGSSGPDLTGFGQLPSDVGEFHVEVLRRTPKPIERLASG